MKKSPKKLQEYMDFFTKDFSSTDYPKFEKESFGSGSAWTIKENRIYLPEELRIRQPFIVFIIFVYLRNFKFYGIDEKTAWTIPISYKGVEFILTHRKFGFEMISNSQTEDATKLGIEAMGWVKKCIPFAEDLFQEEVRSITSRGDITLENQFLPIQNRYQFFRKKANTEFAKLKKLTSSSPNEADFLAALRAAFEDRSIRQKHLTTGNNYATAMLDSFYCLIEHVCITTAIP